MSPTRLYIERLAELKEGELSMLRRLAGRPVSDRLHGFDLFTGMWWPLRRDEGRRTPRREPSWLVAKLWANYGRRLLFDASSTEAPPETATLLGAIEPTDDSMKRSYRHRVRTLLDCSIDNIEPHLRWAFDRIADNQAGRPFDWVGLLNDLSDWDAPGNEFSTSDVRVRVRWAHEYLAARRFSTTRHGFANAD